MKRLGFVAALAGAIAAACVPFKGAASSLRSTFALEPITGQTVDFLIMDDPWPRMIEAMVQLPETFRSVRVRLHYDASWMNVTGFSTNEPGMYHLRCSAPRETSFEDRPAFALMSAAQYHPESHSFSALSQEGPGLWTTPSERSESDDWARWYCPGKVVFYPTAATITGLVVHRYEAVPPKAGYVKGADQHSWHIPDDQLALAKLRAGILVSLF